MVSIFDKNSATMSEVFINTRKYKSMYFIHTQLHRTKSKSILIFFETLSTKV